MSTMCLQHLLVSKRAGLLFLEPLKERVLFLSVNAQKCKYNRIDSVEMRSNSNNQMSNRWRLLESKNWTVFIEQGRGKNRSPRSGSEIVHGLWSSFLMASRGNQLVSWEDMGKPASANKISSSPGPSDNQPLSKIVGSLELFCGGCRRL